MDLQKLQTPAPPEKEKNGDSDFKAYTFRNITPNLHRAWKTCAAIVGISMEEFALTAIQNYIEKVTKSRQTQKENDEKQAVNS